MPKSDSSRPLLDADQRANELLSKPETEQLRRGYLHTLREIRQQPSTLLETCQRMISQAEDLKHQLQGVQCLLLTGSGSSEYAGDCPRLALQQDLGIVVQSVASGTLLTHRSRQLPPLRPALMVSLARSGDSPESVGALSLVLESEPKIRHLVLTCNAGGNLATRFKGDSRVKVIALGELTNDRSLVMTSSFTSLALAVRFLGRLETPGRYRTLCEQLSRTIEDLIQLHFDALANVAEQDFGRVVFLGSGSNFAAAREAALKMLEMTAGRVTTLCETYLGLRHGPMSYIHKDSLVVCFLSGNPSIRAYETDLLRELDRKNLGLLKLLIGEDVPQDVVRKNDVVLDCQGLASLADEDAYLVHVVAGQGLAFFRCLKEGLRPDSPSEDGVINRVVESFRLHSNSQSEA